MNVVVPHVPYSLSHINVSYHAAQAVSSFSFSLSFCNNDPKFTSVLGLGTTGLSFTAMTGNLEDDFEKCATFVLACRGSGCGCGCRPDSFIFTASPLEALLPLQKPLGNEGGNRVQFLDPGFSIRSISKFIFT